MIHRILSRAAFSLGRLCLSLGLGPTVPKVLANKHQDSMHMPCASQSPQEMGSRSDDGGEGWLERNSRRRDFSKPSPQLSAHMVKARS